MEGITVMNYRVNKITSSLLIHIKTMPEDKLLFWQHTNDSALNHEELLSFKCLSQKRTSKMTTRNRNRTRRVMMLKYQVVSFFVLFSPF